MQLEDYLDPQRRPGDGGGLFATRMLKVFDYFRPFQNADGLLHDLKGWVFVEWSKSNEFVQPLNYPTNMLYAATLAAAGRIYNLPHFVEQAESLRKIDAGAVLDGHFFVDNAVLKDGKFVPTQNRTRNLPVLRVFLRCCHP